MTSRRLLDPTAKLFLVAADHIEKYGHCQGRYFADPRRSESSPACLFGAMMLASGDGIVPSSAVVRLERHMNLGGDLTDAVKWNDRPGRTKEEVVAVLRKAAIEGNLP